MGDLYDLGDRPPLGVVPRRMHAHAVRQSRFGPPATAWRHEVIATPTLKADEVLVYVMASGINFNNVWAALGTPVDVIAERQRLGELEDFHAGGSDCAGIVWAIGSNVTHVEVGDEVVVHSGWWRADDPWVLRGRDPVLAESTRVWGYQTNDGSYCQFARAQAHQCVPKPRALTWEEAGCFLLCGSTAYRMLMGWHPNVIEPDEIVLVWGAAGGLGSMALDIVRELGWRAVAVVSDESKRHYCLDRGAIGVIDRRAFDHWGPLPDNQRHHCLRQMGQGRARLRQEHLGGGRRAHQSSHRLRAPGGSHACHVRLRVFDRRHGRDLRRDDRLQRDARLAPPLDAAEALPGQPSGQRRAGRHNHATRD